MSLLSSDAFGLDTWMVIHHFLMNADTLLHLITFYQNSITDLDKTTVLDQQERLRIKQTILLDIAIKLVILIEVMMVLVDALSTGHYKSIPKKMTYYSFESVYHFIDKIRNNEYDWRNVLGLPLPSKLPLSNEEQRYLFRNYEQNYAWIREAITRFAEFYDKFRIVYGKYKHGLTIQAGLLYRHAAQTPLLGNSILVCYDRRQKERMPKNYFVSNPSGDYGGFFNTIGIISFSQQLLDEINSIAAELKYVIYYICHNHLTYAKNCGEGYLPYVVDGNRIAIRISYIPSQSDADIALHQTIVDKIAPLINSAEDKLTTNFNTTRQEVYESISKNSVTNLWLAQG